jgi:hypothetical protein
MTLEIRNAIWARDRLNSSALEFRAEKRRVAAMIKSAESRLAKKNFGAALPTRVLWANFRWMGFVVEDYADYCSNLKTPTVMVPLTPAADGET